MPMIQDLLALALVHETSTDIVIQVSDAHIM